jgi:lipopolysaccharide transport protein LptA
VVTAKTAVQPLDDTSRIKLNEITGDLTDANKAKTNLKAAHGLYNSKTNELELFDGIDVVSESGMHARLSRATVRPKDNTVVSEEPVVVEIPTGTIRSKKLTLRNKTRKVTFLDSVEARLTPEKKSGETAAPKAAPAGNVPLISAANGPIDVTANRLDIDDEKKIATFFGTVRAVQGGAALETAALEVHYEGQEAGATANAAAGARIRRIATKSPVVMTRAPQDRVSSQSLDFDAINEVAVLTGSVVMTSGADRRVLSDAATIDQRADTILLTGNVDATQGRNVLKGERLYVERATGRTHLSSPAAPGESTPGRIATRFYAGEAAKGQSDKQKQDAAGAGPATAAGVFKTDPAAPIDVEADHLDVDDPARVAVFKGDVRATQGDFVVRTAELRARYTGAAGLAEPMGATTKRQPAQLDHVEARGKVIVTSKDGQSATGDWANFDVKSNKVTLGGDVVLTQEKNVVRGTRLVIDMATGQSIIQNDPAAAWSATAAPGTNGSDALTVQGPTVGGRPSAVFYPRKKKDEAPKARESSPDSPAGSGWEPESPAP